MTVPVLEEYLINKFQLQHEDSYLGQKNRFFEFVERSGNGDVIDFCKKHITVKDEKAPAFRTLIERAIIHLNGSGYGFDKAMAEKIKLSRSKLFHRLESGDEDILSLYDETLVIAAMLMLLALSDLGVDIAAIASRDNSFTDLRAVCGKSS